MNLLIAIDDTDNDVSIGTGRLARLLAGELERKRLGSRTSVTRHQLLMHSDIPYTSHNSCACIEMEAADHNVKEIAEFAKGFLFENYHEGANPGLCVVAQGAVPEKLGWFGYRVQREVIAIEEARTLGEKLGLLAWWHGETGRGCIGAMAGVGLRSSGMDGRFIALEGIRELRGTITVGALLGASGIKQVMSVSGKALQHDEIIDTQDWVRPTLCEGQPVLFVREEESVWRSAEKRKRKA